MTIEKPRGRRVSGRGGGRGGRKGRGRGRGGRGGRRFGAKRKDNRVRTHQEQLDYEMELLKAQRDGREKEFLEEERKKLHEKRLAKLDAEMDDYFNKREDDDPTGPKEGDQAAENKTENDGKKDSVEQDESKEVAEKTKTVA